MSARISQREARRLRKRVETLEAVLREQRAVWSAKYPGGVNIGTVTFTAGHTIPSIVDTARRLDHAVVAINSGETLLLYALPHYKANL